VTLHAQTKRFLIALVCLAAVLASPRAVADSYVDRVNGQFASIPDDRRSDLVLLPILAELTPPPAAIGGPSGAMLLMPGDALWPLAEGWATGAWPGEIFEALERITSVEDPRRAFVYAQPYGLEATDAEFRGTRLAIRLAGGRLLASADYGYLSGLTNIETLVHIEVGRRLSEGEAARALGLLRDWAYFSRQICDRPFFAEARWGFLSMVRAFERMRDVAYVDFHGSRTLGSGDLSRAIARIAPEGYLDFSRLPLPEGERIAAEQLASRTLGPDAPTDGFAAEMALATTGPRPLRLFGEATRWAGAGDIHRGRSETLAELDRIYGDLIARFKAPEHSPLLDPPTLLSRVSSGRFALIDAVCSGMDEIFPLREWLRTEAVGTRHALGAVGYALRFGAFPPDVSAIRPEWVDRIEADPWNPDRAAGRVPPLGYFVPVRDRTSPEPHEVKFESSRLSEPVELVFGEDVFVMYSVGPDETNGFARTLRDSLEGRDTNRDHIVWPPAVTLLRALSAR